MVTGAGTIGTIPGGTVDGAIATGLLIGELAGAGVLTGTPVGMADGTEAGMADGTVITDIMAITILHITEAEEIWTIIAEDLHIIIDDLIILTDLV